MEDQVIFIYCLSDEILNALQIEDDPQTHMNTAEIITFAIFSALYFQANYRKARTICKSLKFFPRILPIIAP